jgi:riboflavin kinase/FMN adenylyltransferase
LLDYRGDLHGERVGLHFVVRLREQRKFGGVEELVEELGRDVAATRGYVPEIERIRRSGLIGL